MICLNLVIFHVNIVQKKEIKQIISALNVMWDMNLNMMKKAIIIIVMKNVIFITIMIQKIITNVQMEVFAQKNLAN